jgi:hypothetical protein
MTLYGGEPTLNQRPSLGAVQSSGRETPVRFGAATLGMAA